MVPYCNKKLNFKNDWKMQKILEKSGKFVSLKKGNHEFVMMHISGVETIQYGNLQYHNFGNE